MKSYFQITANRCRYCTSSDWRKHILQHVLCSRRPDIGCKQSFKLYLQPDKSNWSDTAGTWNHAGGTFPQEPRSVTTRQWVPDPSRRNHNHIYKRNPQPDCGVMKCSLMAASTLGNYSIIIVICASFIEK